MFRSKYIFETKQTRYARYLKNIFFILFILSLFYSVSCIFFVQFSKNEAKRSLEALYKRPPDLITVFTGDLGRIPYAVSMAKKYNQSGIFITGVHSKNSVETLLKPLETSKNIDPNKLEIDYLARNTVENVISTLRYLRKSKGIKRIIIVSHDYHIMRIKLIMNKIKDKNDPFEFYYTGVTTDYSNFRNLKILYKEVYKYLRTYAFLLLWDSDTNVKIVD